MTTNQGAMRSELFPLLYGELRRRARQYLRKERRNHTLQPTALVHEAWMKLQKDKRVDLQGKTHALALAAQAMRRVLMDHGRHQKRDKRWGGLQHVTIDDMLKGSTRDIPIEDLLTLEGAIGRLEVIDPRAAQVVVLRFYSGLSTPEVALHLGVSVRTVEGDWTHARIWLKRELAESPT